MAPTVLVEGNDELRRLLRQIADKGLVEALKDAHRSVAQLVADRAVQNTPVRSGRLRKSVKALASQKDARVKAGTASVDYAAAIHWGRTIGNVWGGRMAPNPIKGRPFLWDAVESTKDKATEEFEHAMDDLFDQVRNR